MSLGLRWQRDRGYGGKVRCRKLQKCHGDNIRIIPSLSLVCGQKLYHEKTTMKRCFVENWESLRDWFTPTLGLCRCALVCKCLWFQSFNHQAWKHQDIVIYMHAKKLKSTNQSKVWRHYSSTTPTRSVLLPVATLQLPNLRTKKYHLW